MRKNKTVIKALLLLVAFSQLMVFKSVAQQETKPDTVSNSKSEPFAFGDFTWLNGNDRRHKFLLDGKYFTGNFMLDVNYTASNHHPIDNTVVGSTALARNNEFELSFASIGGEFHYKHARGKLTLQFGTRSTV